MSLAPGQSLDDPARLEALRQLGLMDAPAGEAFDRLTRLACRFLGTPTSLVSLVDAQRQFFASFVGLPPWAAERRQTLLTHSFCQHVVTEGAPLVINDARAHPLVRDNPAIKDLGVAAYLGLPIRAPGGLVLGSFCVIDAQPRTWTEREIELMTELAQLVSDQIALRHENRERRRADAALVRLNHLQQAVLDGTVHSVISTTPEGIITLFSRGAELMLGYTREEMVGRQTPEILHVSGEVVARAAEISARIGKDIRPSFEVFVEPARRGLADEREWTYIRKDGSRLPVYLSVTALRDDAGNITGFLGIARDLTVQKRAEIALRQSEEKLGQVLGHAECLVWEATVELLPGDWHWHMSAYPSALYRRLTAEHAVGEEAGLWYRFAIPERDEMTRRSRQAMESGAPGYAQEFRLVKGSEVVWLREVVAITPREPGRFWLVGVATDITERKRAEEQRDRSERLVRAITDNVPGMVAYWTKDLRCTFANRGYIEWFGRKPTEVVGLRMQELLGPELFARNEPYVRGALRGEPQVFERTLTKANGEVGYTLAHYVPDLAADEVTTLGFFVLVSDITDIKRKEMELRQSEQALHDIFRSMAEGLVLQKADASIVECNDAATRILGLTRDQLMGRTSLDPTWKTVRLDGTHFPGNEHPAIVTLRTGQPCRDVMMGVCQPDGSVTWISINTEPLKDAATGEQMVVCSFADVTERVRTESALAQARDDALAASRLKSEFLANMSHEIRTPMNGVIGMADLLIDTPLSAEQQQMARVIRGSADSLLTVINDILDFSKIEAGKLSIQATDFNLADQVDQAVALLGPRARARGLALGAEVTPELPPQLVGDPGRIQQVLMNLIGNAVKFTEQGAVAVVVLARPPAREHHFAFRVEIRDTGIGIAEKEKGRLFQPFTQADGSSTRKYGGTGLGLAISQQLVDLMQGRMGFESVLGQGSVFWFDLELPVGLGVAPARAPEPTPRASRRPITAEVLVAEDNTANQLVIRLLLEKLGLGCEIVADGREVINRLAAREFAAVLMDCQMPGLDGYEAARLIRGGYEGVRQPRIPIVALTAHAMASDRERCLAAGMNEYLSKPVRLEKLRGVLARFGVGEPGPAAPVAAPAPPARGEVLEPRQVAQLRELPGRAGGTLLADVVEMALRELPAEIARLRSMSDTQAATEVVHLAHRLGGSAANLGAQGLRERFQAVEWAARANDWTAVQRAWPELDREWDVVRDALQKLSRTPPR